MNMSDYPHITITEDGRLCSTSHHRSGFPRVLYNALLHLGYNEDVPVYRARMSMAHGLDQCDVNVTIPLNTVEQTTQVALTSLFGSCLTNTAVVPITLFPTHCQGDPMWQQCLEAISDPEGPYFHAGMTAMAEYAQYSFDL
jgi:hypothetical protein